jgi:hypothetical protein
MNRSVYVGGGYRARIERKLHRAAAKAKSDREDALAYVEPHLRDYEDAHLAVYGQAVQLEYKLGYATYKTGDVTFRYRIPALIAKTAELQAKAVIINREDT